MGMEAEDDPFVSSETKFLNDNYTTDVPLNCQIFGDMNPPYDFGSVLCSDDLSDSLLNKGLYTPFDPTQPEASRCPDVEIGATLPTSNQNIEKSAIDDLSGLHTTFSPSASVNGPFNTNTGYNFNHPPQVYTPFTARIPSSLRNEYHPGDSYGTSSSVMAGPGHQHHVTSSPSKYKINTRPWQPMSRNLHNFNQSELQSPFNQIQSYDTNQQAICDPRPRLNQLQLHPIHNDQHTHHPSGQLNYGIAPHAMQNEETHPSSTQPCTPPSGRSPPNVGSSASNLCMASPSDVTIKRETLASGSPSAKKRTRKGIRRKAVEQLAISDDDSPVITKSEGVYVKELVKAMTDGAKAEDNPGMQNTWDKIRENKADKVREKCVELLGLLQRAQREQLVEKKAVNIYRNFDHRFDETCAALRTQKTVCKHLMEAPYSHIVANDPTYAAQRVRNNRRVNGQKRQAITMGRQALGLQGQGKGKSMKKIEPVPFDDLYDDGEDSGDDFDAEEEDPMEAPIPVVKVESSGRKKARKARKSDSDDDYEDNANYSPPPKKAKRGRRSTHVAPGNAQQVGNAQSSTKSSGQSNGFASITSGTPSHHLEPKRQMKHHHGAEQSGYFNTGNSYGAMAPRLPSLPQELYTHGYQHGSQSNTFPYDQLGYSPSPDFQHIDDGDGGNDANPSWSRF